MSDVLQTGLEWLAAQLGTAVSQSVTYRRGTLSVAIDATLGAKVLRVTDSAGRTKVERADLDLIFPVAALDFGDGPTDPAVGDYAEVAQGGTTYRYDVLPIGTEPHFRKESRGVMLRVHTKLRGEA